jgi:hypothetical protein
MVMVLCDALDERGVHQCYPVLNDALCERNLRRLWKQRPRGALRKVLVLVMVVLVGAAAVV